MNDTRTSQVIRKTFMLMLALGAVMLLAGAVSSVVITRAIMGGIGGEPAYAAEVSARIAGGDLNFQIRTRPDDSTSLLATMQRMQLELKRMITQSRNTATQMAEQARALTTISTAVAQRSMHQTNAAISMATSVQQVNGSISHVADNAGRARSMTDAASRLSIDGAVLVQSTIAKINHIASSVAHSSQVVRELGEHSGQISGIVKTIKEIADQTNLLALNAAIEAARAGEQGRGFAVVADEVRKLAERTTASTQEIATMIETIQKSTQSAVAGMAEGAHQVREGVELAAKTGESMKEIEASTREVSAVVEDISNTLREQSAASGNIADNVDQIVQMIEENAATDREESAAASCLEQLAEALKASVDQFKV
jgi:methyl-accepting chemotaxis protein